MDITLLIVLTNLVTIFRICHCYFYCLHLFILTYYVIILKNILIIFIEVANRFGCATHFVQHSTVEQ